MKFSEALAFRILFLCQQQGITVNKLAHLSGLTQSTVDSIVNGKSKNPRYSTIKKMASGFDMTVTEFLKCQEIDNADID